MYSIHVCKYSLVSRSMGTNAVYLLSILQALLVWIAYSWYFLPEPVSYNKNRIKIINYNRILKSFHKNINPHRSHRAQSHTPYPPCAQSPVWWSVQRGGGRSRSTAPREPFPPVPGRSGRARYQRPPPTSWVSHTAVLTRQPCSFLCAGGQYLHLTFECPVGSLLDITGVHNHLKYDRNKIWFVGFPWGFLAATAPAAGLVLR